MKENSDGWLHRAVVSLAGRDKGVICLVLREEGEYLFLADGKLRPVERPKKKKRKHTRLLADECGNAFRFDGELLTNRFVRQWLCMTAERFTTGRRSSSG